MRIHCTRRCGPIGTLSGVGGGGLANFHAMLPSPSTASRSSSRVSVGWRAAWSARRASRNGNLAIPSTPFAISVASEGSGRAVHGSAPTGVGVGDVSNSTVVMSTPETPSTRQ